MRYFLAGLFFLFGGFANGQFVKYQGKIVNDESNLPVKRAAIVAFPSGKQTLSKDDGSFELIATDQDQVITIEHIGYKCIAVSATDELDSIALEKREVLVPAVLMYLYGYARGIGEDDYHEFNKLGFHAGFKFGTKNFRNELKDLIGLDSAYTEETPTIWVRFAINEDGVLENFTMEPSDTPVGDVISSYFNSVKRHWLPAKFGGINFKEYFRMPIQFEPTFTKVDEKPVFPGGDKAFEAYIKENIVLPADYLKADVGRVFLSFDIEKDGKVANVKVVKGINCIYDHEAIRLLENSPNWIPGKQKGKPIRYLTSTSVSF